MVSPFSSSSGEHLYSLVSKFKIERAVKHCHSNLIIATESLSPSSKIKMSRNIKKNPLKRNDEGAEELSLALAQG